MQTDTHFPADADGIGWNVENTYSRMPQTLFKCVAPAAVSEPRVSVLNHSLARELGLSLREVSDDTAAALFAGQQLPAGAQPIAQAYAGHQFGGFTMLGDGRAILLGEQRTPSGGLFDIQFKGSGQTPFSRSGDGLAALGPMLREYIISEAMQALGIPTTRGLAVVTTGEPVYREKPLRGAILTRVAASHIRVGTFQYLAIRRDEATLKVLADYTIDRHYPEIPKSAERYLLFLRSVMQRQASLIAQWQLVGFIHGVMNTDNMSISGETIDYGPCAFMDIYHPETVFSSIDHGGRYAFGNQPAIGQWNLARFAEALLPLLDNDENNAIALAMDVLNEYPTVFEGYWLGGMRRKLGLAFEQDGDRELIKDLLEWMQETRADFTNTFDDLSTDAELGSERAQDERFRSWYSRWQERVECEDEPWETVRSRMCAANPAVIPRNHRVEEALTAATDEDDLSVMNWLLEALTSPYERNELSGEYRIAPPPDQCRYQTFCGT